MGPLSLLAALLLLPLNAAADASRCASGNIGARRAQQLCGLALAVDETVDPWLGYRLRTSAPAVAEDGFEALASGTLARMLRGEGIDDPAERACAGAVARLLTAQTPDIALGEAHGFDALYDPGAHRIVVSADPAKAYLRSEANLRRKLMHEALHVVQSIPVGLPLDRRLPDTQRLPADCPTIHAYEQRAAILTRLRDAFRDAYPNVDSCVFPEVPAACRGSVPDCTGSSFGGGPAARRVRIPPSLPAGSLRELPEIAPQPRTGD